MSKPLEKLRIAPGIDHNDLAIVTIVNAAIDRINEQQDWIERLADKLSKTAIAHDSHTHDVEIEVLGHVIETSLPGSDPLPSGKDGE